MPPAAPAFATVSVSALVLADTVSPAPFTTVAPSETSAVVVTSTKFSATEAPIPTLPPVTPASTGAAVAVAVKRSSAVTVDPRISAFTVAPDAIFAVFSIVSLFSATDPAIPTLEPPAPDDADALIVSRSVSVGVSA